MLTARIFKPNAAPCEILNMIMTQMEYKIYVFFAEPLALYLIIAEMEFSIMKILQRFSYRSALSS